MILCERSVNVKILGKYIINIEVQKQKEFKKMKVEIAQVKFGLSFVMI